MSYAFFAYLSRLKLIRRWSLMRNTQPENDADGTGITGIQIRSTC